MNGSELCVLSYEFNSRTMKISPEQLKCLHTLFSRLGISGDTKLAIISPATITRELSFSEAGALIKRLKEQQNSLNPARHAKAEKMRRKIISMAHEIGWQKPGTALASPKADIKRIDDWCRKFGYLKKALDNYTCEELPQLVTQFEYGPYKHYFFKL